MITKPGRLFGGMLLCALICFAATTFGQGSQQMAKDKRRAQELERQAYALVDEIATGAHGLKLPENRSFMLASAADLLWPHDEKRARAMFWNALNSINILMLPARNGGASKTSIAQKDQKRYFAIFALRQGLLRKAARHDPQLALDMLRSTRQLPAEQIQTSFQLPDNSELEQQIATEAMTRDPQHALQLARQSLEKGLTFQLLELLDRLNSRDQDVAAKFAGDVIEKLQTKNLSADIVASRIAVELLTWSRKPTGPFSQEDPTVAHAQQLTLDEEKRRHLAEMIANAALEVSPNSTLLNSIGEIMPEIQEFLPERVALLRRKLAGFEQTLNKEQRGWNNYNSLVRSGSPEEMIAASMKVDDQQRQMLRQQAIVVAVHRQRAEPLRAFIKSEIADEPVQKALMESLDSEQISAATSRGDAAELRTLLPRVGRTEERARAMAAVAVVLEKTGDHEEAVKLLDEARTLIKVDLASETQTNGLFALMAAYAVVDPPKAFAILERTIDRANDQISKALLLDKIVKTGAVRNGEILLDSGIISSNLILFRYGNAVVAMANADFNRTKVVADRLDRPELRLLARLSLAQALLAQNERSVQ